MWESYRYENDGARVKGLYPRISLLDPYDRDRGTGLMKVLDIVNTTYGPGTLRFGLQGFRNAK